VHSIRQQLQALPVMKLKKVRRPRSSDRLRCQFLLTAKHREMLTTIASQKGLMVAQGLYKGKPNLNAAIIWLIENHQ
jgi:hypothetical protein